MKPTRARSMRMKCAECMHWHADGLFDCQVRSCPIYSWMPYRRLEPDLSWVDHRLPKSPLKPKRPAREAAMGSEPVEGMER